MPTIEKLQSGFIYKEDFSQENVMWQFFPNDESRYSRVSNSLILKQGVGRVIALTKAPDDDFTFQCKVTHQPLSTNSFAGVVLLRDNDDWVECQLYRDADAAVQVFYSYIKIVKIGVNYYFYASKDNVNWITAGAMAYDDCHLIGFYFDSDDPVETVKIENVVFYKSPVISVTGINVGDTVQIKDSSNTVLVSKVAALTTLDIDLTQKAMPMNNCKIVHISPGGTTQTGLLNINGGDVYGVKYNIKLKVNGIVVNPNTMFDLGKIYTGTDNLLTLENLDPNYSIYNLKLSIEQYSPFDYGFQNVDMMPAIHDADAVYAKEIVIDKLSDTPIDILMRINRETDIAALFKTSGFKYKIIIE